MNKIIVDYYQGTEISSGKKTRFYDDLIILELTSSLHYKIIRSKLINKASEFESLAEVNEFYQEKVDFFHEAASFFETEISKNEYDEKIEDSKSVLDNGPKPHSHVSTSSAFNPSKDIVVYEFIPRAKARTQRVNEIISALGGISNIKKICLTNDINFIEFEVYNDDRIKRKEIRAIDGVTSLNRFVNSYELYVDKDKISVKSLKDKIHSVKPISPPVPDPISPRVPPQPSSSIPNPVPVPPPIPPKPTSSIVTPASPTPEVTPPDWIDDILNSLVKPTPRSNSSANTTSSAATSSSHAVFPQNSLTDGWILRKNITIASFKFELIGTFLLSLVIGMNSAVVWLLFTESQYFEKFFKSGDFDFWFIHLKNPEFTLIKGLFIFALIPIASIAISRVSEKESFYYIGGLVSGIAAYALIWSFLDQLFSHFSLVTLILFFVLLITIIELYVEYNGVFLSDDMGLRQSVEFDEYFKKPRYSGEETYKGKLSKNWRDSLGYFSVIAILGALVGGVGIFFGYSYFSKNVQPPVPTATQVLQNGDYYFETTSDLTKEDGNYQSLYQNDGKYVYGFVTKPSIQDNKNASDTLVNPFESFSKNSFKYTYITSDINYYDGIISGKDLQGPTVYLYTENQLKSLYSQKQKHFSPVIQQLLKGTIYLPVRSDSYNTQSYILSSRYNVYSFTATGVYNGDLKTLPFAIDKKTCIAYSITGNSIKLLFDDSTNETFSNLHIENGTIIGTESLSYVDKDKKPQTSSYPMKFLNQQQFEQLPK